MTEIHTRRIRRKRYQQPQCMDAICRILAKELLSSSSRIIRSVRTVDQINHQCVSPFFLPLFLHCISPLHSDRLHSMQLRKLSSSVSIRSASVLAYILQETDCGAGDQRNNGFCDKSGCDFNSYRQGNTSFYGPGKTIDTTKKITAVTQFITSDGTANGDLVEIKRMYVFVLHAVSKPLTNIFSLQLRPGWRCLPELLLRCCRHHGQLHHRQILH
jgi:hypothetical protein